MFETNWQNTLSTCIVLYQNLWLIHTNSETEDECDSGNESAGSERSGVSRVSAASHDISATPAKTSRRPTVKLSLTRDLSKPDDGDGEESMDIENMETVRNFRYFAII